MVGVVSVDQFDSIMVKWLLIYIIPSTQSEMNDGTRQGNMLKSDCEWQSAACSGKKKLKDIF